LLDGHEFRVTRNLERALLRLRRRRKSTLVWIDAIVINQSDIQERNSQVRQMAQTYQSASRVFIWLGEGNKKVSRFLAWTTGIGRLLSYFPALYSTQLMDGLLHVAAMSYWSRAWVLQEVAFAKKPTLIYGYDRFKFSIGFTTMNRLIDKDVRWMSTGKNASSFTSELPQISRFAYFDHIRKTLKEFSYIDFPEWIDDNGLFLGGSSCSNHLDHIFGYHSLFSPKTKRQIPIDYQTSVKDLYTLVTRLAIEKRGNLEMLCIIPSRRRQQPDLPSWVLDFSGENIISKLSVSSEAETPRVENAQAFYQFEGDSILHVKGINLGTVTGLANTLESRIDTASRSALNAFKFVADEIKDHWNGLLTQLGFNESELASIYQSSIWLPKTLYRFLGCPDYNSITGADDHESEFHSATRLGSSNNIDAHTEELFVWMSQDFHIKHTSFSCAVPVAKNEEEKRKSVLGFATQGVKVGDTIVSILGCVAPMVLRSDGDYHVIVGVSVVLGLEGIEAFQTLEPTSESLRDFYLK
jgi:hypothetical protein